MHSAKSSALTILSCLMLWSCAATVAGDDSLGGGGGGGSSVDAGFPGDDDPQDPPDGVDPALHLELSPAKLQLEVGQDTLLEVVVRDDNGDVLSDAGTLQWESGDLNVAMVGEDGLLTAMAEGFAVVTVSLGDASASMSLNVVSAEQASCVQGQGNNGDSCADIYQGADIWRCTVSPALDNATVSQVCRDTGSGPKWITFHISPTDCCACDGDFNAGCCAPNSGSVGCP